MSGRTTSVEEPITDKLLNGREVSGLTGFGQSYIAKLRRDGMPSIRINSRTYRYSWPAVRAWLSKQGQ